MPTKKIDKPHQNVSAPPSNGEAEELVLGTVLMWPETGAEVVAALSAGDFFTTKNGLIFSAIHSLVNDGTASDTVAVANWLDSKGDLDKAGGRLRLNELMKMPVTQASLGHYLTIVREKSARRKLGLAGARIQDLSQDEARDLRDVASQATKILEETRLAAEGGLADFFAPVVEANESTVRVDWMNLQVRAVVTGLKEHKDGDVDGFLKISTTVPGHPRDLHSARFNFVASRSQTEWANLLTKRADITDWHEVMSSLCRIVTDHVHAGDPVESVGDVEEVPVIQHALRPLVLYESPTVLFGEPATLKSYIGILCAYLVSCGEDYLDFHVERLLKNPLYLDWEGERGRMDERLLLLHNGTGLPRAKFQYRHCARPLAADVDRIREQILENGNEFIIIDSLGLACGGDLNAPQPAIDFFSALRTLRCSSLVIAHNAKNSMGDRSIFGSVFFSALARSIWEAKTDKVEGSSEVEVGIVHKKANYGMLEHPFGLRFCFEPGRTRVESCDAKDVASASSARPLGYRIRRLLEERGKMTPAEIAEELGADPEVIRGTLNRLRDRHEVLRIERGLWAAEIGANEHEQSPF